MTKELLRMPLTVAEWPQWTSACQSEGSARQVYEMAA